AQLFQEQVKRTPHHTALFFKEDRLTYGELNEKADVLAHTMRAEGAGAGEIVALMAERSLEMMAGILAILKNGCAYLPLDPEYPAQRIEYMLEDCNTGMILTDRPQNLPASRSISCIVDIKDARVFEGVDNPDAKRENLWPSIPTTSLAYICYTSGSTGKPRGVMLENRSVINFFKGVTDILEFTPKDAILSLITISFDIFILETLLPLTRGTMVVLGDREEQSAIPAAASAIEKKNITILQVTPSMLQLFASDKKGVDSLKQLTYLLVCAEAFPPALLEKVRRTMKGEIFNLYGPTETTVWSTYKNVSNRNTLTIGKPFANTQVYILGKTGRVMPVGSPGELCIGGDGVARGYMNRVELTAEKFLPDPYAPGKRYYKTGDLAKWRPEGEIDFLGRLDHQVKINGIRVEPGEIENLLLKHPCVKEAVVVVRGDEKGKGYLYAAVVSEIALTAAQLREYLLEKLPLFLVPAYFVQLEKMPLTPNKKIDRHALPDPETFLQKKEATYVEPKSHREIIIAKLWREVLEREKIGTTDNFFDLGGNSLDIIRLKNRMQEAFNKTIPVNAMFRYPSISSFGSYLDQENLEGEGTGERRKKSAVSSRNGGQAGDSDAQGVKGTGPGMQVAVIGMTGRFPGARNIGEFWDNLINGVHSISFFSEEELEQAGINPGILKEPGYIRAKGVLEDAEYFDSSFFSYSTREAAVMDPQLRILHECAWEALENAGYSTDKYDGLIGFYTGATSNFFWVSQFLEKLDNPSELFFISNLNDSGSFATAISYKLNLKGAGVYVHTACSTSLVAIHAACKGLFSGECDIALAGGVSVTYPLKSGYIYQEGMIFSPDGRCRAFDVEAKGTVGGNGAGLVVLKPLKEAIEDRDTIYAVIKGTAINNDGNRKVGYTAPSIDGQAEVIGAVHNAAGVEPESIGYIEAHGTGTTLGDPIEIEALKTAFGTGKNGYCGIGSVKTNVGHLDTAAGVTGFIKTVLAIKNRLIPPSINYEKPNPKIDFKNSPFYVVTKTTPWKNDNGPLRAGVSSFGIGGTNAHVLLEEAPQIENDGEIQNDSVRGGDLNRNYKLLMLSAETPDALERQTVNFADYIKKNPGIDLADAAYTLQVGRNDLKYRSIAVCENYEKAVDALSGESGEILTASCEKNKIQAVFMFPGQGSQYVEMGRELYKEEPVFREEMDRCFVILEPLLGFDVKKLLYPAAGRKEGGTSETGVKTGLAPVQGTLTLTDTAVAQPVLFAVEYALAKLVIHWGIKPYAMIGHSIGEYAAACISGVFSPEDALKIVVARGKLMQQMPGGAMMGVQLPENELKKIVPPGISLAAVNGPHQAVVSGTY
ncbi:MAG: amino acid adenylation domain-containing protein, partial [bacterium]|nr:amino acid adenylation domain-containing protein [bacterium]